MAKLDKGFAPTSVLQSLGGLGIFLLVITAGAIVPLKAIELFSGCPILDELVSFAQGPSMDFKTKNAACNFRQ